MPNKRYKHFPTRKLKTENKKHTHHTGNFQKWSKCLSKTRQKNQTTDNPDTGLLHIKITDSTVQIKFTVFLMTLNNRNCIFH